MIEPEEGAALITGAFDPRDAFLPEFRKGAMNRIEYLLGVRPLKPDLPQAVNGYLPDMRDMN